MGTSISLAPDVLFSIGSFPVTNTFIWMVFISLILMLTAIIVTKRLKEAPGRFQGFVEVLIGGSFDFVKSVIGSERKAKKVYPYVFTLFLFIVTANLFVYIPGQSAIIMHQDEGKVAVFRAVMSDYGMVFIMTIMSVLISQIVAIFVHGPFGYLGKFINLKGFSKFFKLLFKGKFKPGVFFQGFLDFFLGVMDLVGEVAKIISLSFRLFGNIFAGEVLGAIMLFLAPFFIPLPFMFLGLLTAVVQAFVFAVLTLIFITMASEIEDNELAERVTL